MLAGLTSFVEIRQVNYLNYIIEQDHRFIKKITQPMMGFKARHSARATLDGMGSKRHMICKSQLTEENMPAYEYFMALAG
jgi:putative transposase